MYLNYWCKDEEEKQKLIKQYAENEEKEKEKFKIDFLRKNENLNIKSENNENQMIIVEKSNWIKRILKKFIK